MSTELPIGCTLTAAELPARLAEMRSIGEDALTSATCEGRRAELRFRSVAGAAERLGAIVAAESACCAFLDLRLSGDDAGLLLTIEAPAGGQPVVSELVATFRGGA